MSLANNFQLFQAAVFTSILVHNMLSVATAWHVYDQTHSPLDLGWVGLCQFLPAFCMTFLSGQLADRFDRRKLMIVAGLLMGASSLALWGLAALPFSRLAFFAVIGMSALAKSLEAPSAASLVADLVPREMLPQAIAWNSSVKQVAKMVGPALGGLAYGVFGEAREVFLICSVGCLTTALLITRIHLVINANHQYTSVSFESLRQGFRHVLSNDFLLGAISLDMVAVLLGGAVALLPIYAKDILHVGPLGLGCLRSAPALGSFAMALWLGRHPVKWDIGNKLLLSVALYGVATCVFGLSTDLWVSVVALLVLGAADNVSVVLRQSLVQLGTPNFLRGRVSSVNQAFIVTANQLGEFESGVTAALWGTVPAVVVGGLGTVLIALAWPVLFPGLRGLRTLPRLAEA